MSRVKFTIPDTDPEAKKSYKEIFIETEGVKPETVQRIKSAIRQRPEILEESRFESSGHVFEIKRVDRGSIFRSRFETEIKMIR